MTKRHPSCVLLEFPPSIVCRNASSTNVLLLSRFHQSLITSSNTVVFPCRACMLSMLSDFGVALTEEHNSLLSMHPLFFCLTPPPNYQSPPPLLVQAKIYIICASALPYIVVVSAREAVLIIRTAVTRQPFSSGLV